MKKHVFYIVMIASLLVFLLPTAANTVIGLDATFRAHPELTFRLLANAIYNALNWGNRLCGETASRRSHSEKPVT